MPMQREEDWPIGHPARFDTVPESKEAVEWRRKNVHPKGERDWPVDHIKAVDTPGNLNHIHWVAGVDPSTPSHEPFSGRDPDTAARVREIMRKLTQAAKVSPALAPTVAPKPPAPGDTSPPSGQPGG